ncbi:hypothetical protein FOBRF1_009712 [Fusarium oxysporum]
MFVSKSAIVGLLLPSSSAVSLTYSKLYDNNSIPVSQLACYKNGLIMDGQPEWQTIGDIPHSITGLEQVDGPDSPLCVSRWILTYGETSRPVLILDSAKEGFVSTLDALNWLTGNKGEELGKVEVKTTKVDRTNCAFPLRRYRRDSDVSWWFLPGICLANSFLEGIFCRLFSSSSWVQSFTVSWIPKRIE